jgi:hypothetical protein
MCCVDSGQKLHREDSKTRYRHNGLLRRDVGSSLAVHRLQLESEPCGPAEYGAGGRCCRYGDGHPPRPCSCDEKLSCSVYPWLPSYPWLLSSPACLGCLWPQPGLGCQRNRSNPPGQGDREGLVVLSTLDSLPSTVVSTWAQYRILVHKLIVHSSATEALPHAVQPGTDAKNRSTSSRSACAAGASFDAERSALSDEVAPLVPKRPAS